MQDRQTFAVAFRELVFRKTGTCELHAQPVGYFVAGTFRRFGLTVDD